MKIPKNGYSYSLRLILHREIFYLSAILVLGLLLRIPTMGRGLGEDELETVFYVIDANSIWHIVSSSLSFNNHIGYSLLARFSRALFGKSEWAFRLPALLFGLASLYIFWIFSRSLLGPRLAVIATSLFAFSPVHMIWSITGRGYSVMLFCTLLSSYLYLKLLRYTARRDVILFIVAGVVGIYTHLYSSFTAMVQFLFLLRLRVTQPTTKQPDRSITTASFRVVLFSLITVAALSILCYTPALRNLLYDLGKRGRSNFNPSFPWSVIEFLSGSEGAPLAVLVLIVSLCGLVSLLRSHPREVRYLAFLFLGPLLVMWLARPFDLYPRFFSYWLPYYLVFFVAGLRTLWYSATSYRLGAVQYSSPLLASVAAATVLISWSMNWQDWIIDEGYRDASRAIVMDATDSVAFCAIGGNAEVFQYYFDRQIVVPRSMTDFLKLSRTHPEVRCVYFQTSWESAEHTEIAQFLKQHGLWSSVKKMILFTYRT